MSGVVFGSSDSQPPFECGAVGEDGRIVGRISGAVDRREQEEEESSCTALTGVSAVTAASLSVSCSNRTGARSTFLVQEGSLLTICSRVLDSSAMLSGRGSCSAGSLAAMRARIVTAHMCSVVEAKARLDWSARWCVV